MQRAQAIELDDLRRKDLVTLAQSSTTDGRPARRASIVLLAAEGLDNRRIGELLGIGRGEVGIWRRRYAAGGLEAIRQDLPSDRPAPGAGAGAARAVRSRRRITPTGAATRWLRTPTPGAGTPQQSASGQRHDPDPSAPVAPLRDPGALPGLSVRHLQLLDHLAGGLRYHEAAKAMDLALSTVQSHVRMLYRRLGVHSRAQALSKARAHGLLRA